MEMAARPRGWKFEVHEGMLLVLRIKERIKNFQNRTAKSDGIMYQTHQAKKDSQNEGVHGKVSGMGGFIQKIFWGTPVRKVLSVLTVLFFLPAWVFNYENWLSENGYDKLLTDSESPLLKGLGALAAFLLSSEPRWFLAGAMVALVAEGIWRFRSSRAESVNTPLREWHQGKTRFTLREAGCFAAGISPIDFETSDDAQAQANEMVYYARQALIRPAEMTDRQYGLSRMRGGDHGFDLKGVNLDTFISREKLDRHLAYDKTWLPIIDRINQS